MAGYLGLPKVDVGDVIRLVDGQKGTVIDILEGPGGGFLWYKIFLTSGHVVSEARYRFDVIPSTTTRPDSSVTSEPVTVAPESENGNEYDDIFDDDAFPESNVSPDSNKPTDFSFTDRFDTVQDHEIESFIAGQENKNTARRTLCDMNLIRKFLNSPQIHESRELYSIPPAELCPLLCKYVMGVKRQDGSEYEPNSLRAMLGSFERFLKRHNYGYSLMSSIEFLKLREVLKSKQKQLKAAGKGNMPNKAQPLTDNELEMLWQSGEMGGLNRHSLLNALWWCNSVYFGLRGVTEHRDMRWGDIKLCMDSNGIEYLEYSERNTKTRTGENPRDIRAVPPKAWAIPESQSRCPVALYKLYRSKRPSKYSNPSDPYYIATNTSELSTSWYKCQPVGLNKLGTIMKKMKERVGLSSDKKLTNHSARKYLVQTLRDHKVESTDIIQLTGHKNVQSLNNYSSVSADHHRQFNNILNKTSSNTQPPSHVMQVQNSTNHVNISSSSSSNTSESSTKSQTNRSVDLVNPRNVLTGDIHGGTFNVHVHYHSGPTRDPHSTSKCSSSPVLEPTGRKRRRVMVIESDSDNSQTLDA